MVLSFVHPAKALFPMELTELLRWIDVMFVQFWNAPDIIWFTPQLMVTEVIADVLAKALVSMAYTRYLVPP